MQMQMHLVGDLAKSETLPAVTGINSFIHCHLGSLFSSAVGFAIL